MDELPPHARAALAPLRHAHDPDDPEAQARVRARVAAAVGVAAGAAGLGVASKALADKALAGATPKSLAARLLAHKLGAALSVASLASVGAVAVPTLLTPAQTPAPAPAARPGRAAKPAGKALGEPAREEPAREEPAPLAPPRDEGRDTLPAELALLGEADRALDARRPADALAILLRHADLYPEAALREERLGLEAIARCQLGEPDAADTARAFLRAFQSAVLAQRVKLACAR